MRKVEVSIRRPGAERPLAVGAILARTTVAGTYGYLETLLEADVRLTDGSLLDGDIEIRARIIQQVGGDDEPFPVLA